MDKIINHTGSYDHLKEVLYEFYKQEIKIMTVCGVDALLWCKEFYRNGLICVVNRSADYDYESIIKKLNENQHNHIELVESELVDLSSTKIRLWIKDPSNYEKELSTALHPPVLSFLKKIKADKDQFLNGFEYYQEKFKSLKALKLDIKDINLTDSYYFGYGYSAKVRNAKFKDNIVALKEFSFYKDAMIRKACFNREFRILSTLSSNNIINCYGWTEKPESNIILLVLELATADMKKILPYFHTDPSTLLWCIGHMSKSVIQALKILKEWNIYHRDIMLTNILWCGDTMDISQITKETFSYGNIKLCDFGLSKFQDDPPVFSGWVIRRSPQMVLNRFHYCYWCDLYLFGLTIWEAWTGIDLSTLGIPKDQAKCFIFCGWKPPIQSFPEKLQVLLNTCWAHDNNFSLDHISHLLPQ